MKKIIFWFTIMIFMATISACKKDPCKGIVCKNGGTCANGDCNCPTGYTGSDCGTEKTPSSVTISKIVLNSYPMTTTSSTGWDSFNGPDIFLSIVQGTTSSDIQTSGVASDATGSAITYTNNFPQTITSPSVNWVIGLLCSSGLHAIARAYVRPDDRENKLA